MPRLCLRGVRDRSGKGGKSGGGEGRGITHPKGRRRPEVKDGEIPLQLLRGRERRAVFPLTRRKPNCSRKRNANSYGSANTGLPDDRQLVA